MLPGPFLQRTGDIRSQGTYSIPVSEIANWRFDVLDG